MSVSFFEITLEETPCRRVRPLSRRIIIDGNIENIRKKVILSVKFTGSLRHMREYTQDIITHVNIYRPPDLFEQFSCNPK